MTEESAALRDVIESLKKRQLRFSRNRLMQAVNRSQAN
jgi:hypothetical protein